MPVAALVLQENCGPIQGSWLQVVLALNSDIPLSYVVQDTLHKENDFVEIIFGLVANVWYFWYLTTTPISPIAGTS